VDGSPRFNSSYLFFPFSIIYANKEMHEKNLLLAAAENEFDTKNPKFQCN
jgi:hypothetical protein